MAMAMVTATEMETSISKTTTSYHPRQQQVKMTSTTPSASNYDLSPSTNWAMMVSVLNRGNIDSGKLGC